MTEIQKIIKLIAIAFAIFLTVNIIACIVFGISALSSVLGLTKDKPHLLPELTEISQNEDVITSLDIDINITNLLIQTGDTFKVETNYEKIEYQNKEGQVFIHEEGNPFKWIQNKSSLVITIPEHVSLDTLKINAGVGTTTIRNLSLDNLTLKEGAGAAWLENCEVKKSSNIVGGVGKIDIKKSYFTNLDMDLGVGSFTFEGDILGKSKLQSGVGEVDINLLSDLDDYQLQIKKGLGQIEIAGETIENEMIYGNGEHFLQIEGGIGKISVV